MHRYLEKHILLSTAYVDYHVSMCYYNKPSLSVSFALWKMITWQLNWKKGIYKECDPLIFFHTIGTFLNLNSACNFFLVLQIWKVSKSSLGFTACWLCHSSAQVTCDYTHMPKCQFCIVTLVSFCHICSQLLL